MDDGLDRHEAIHAIGAMLTKFIHDLPESGTEPNAPYFAALERLTVRDLRQPGLCVATKQNYHARATTR